MNYRSARILLIDELNDIYTAGECDNLIARFIESDSSHSILDYKLNPNLEFNSESIKDYIQLLKTFKPVQYILGYEWFGDLKLEVNEHVLIPRPETFELVRWISEFSRAQWLNVKLNILDIGTGSGCIPIWLKKNSPQHKYSAIDISTEALSMARKNAARMQVDIEFINADILQSNLDLHSSFDLIISNPPYISIEEKSTLESNVLDYEPHLALFVQNNDPLQFYKAIHKFSERHLNPRGQLFFELGSLFASQVQAYFLNEGFHTELRKDMYEMDRMLRVWK